MEQPHFALRERQGPKQSIVGSSRQHRLGMDQKGDSYGRVPGGPWPTWFSVRAPLRLRSGIQMSSGPSAMGKPRAGCVCEGGGGGVGGGRW